MFSYIEDGRQNSLGISLCYIALKMKRKVLYKPNKTLSRGGRGGGVDGDEKAARVKTLILRPFQLQQK